MLNATGLSRPARPAWREWAEHLAHSIVMFSLGAGLVLVGVALGATLPVP